MLRVVIPLRVLYPFMFDSKGRMLDRNGRVVPLGGSGSGSSGVGDGPSSLREVFLRAKDVSSKLDKPPSNEVKLQLYGLYKQAELGSGPTGDRPGFLDPVGRSKFDAWSSVKALSKDAAMTKYTELVTQLNGGSLPGGLATTGSGNAASAGNGANGSAFLPAARQDYSGVWKRFKTENYEEFIGAQGAGFMQRKLAASIALTHTITMSADLDLFRLQENGGPICTDWTYAVGSGPDCALGGLHDGNPNPQAAGGDRANLAAQEDLTVFQKGKEFLDTAFWIPENILKVVKHSAPDRKYSLSVHRFLATDAERGRVMRVQAVYAEPGPGGKRVKANSYFEYAGPSPNPPPLPRDTSGGGAGGGQGDEK